MSWSDKPFHANGKTILISVTTASTNVAFDDGVPSPQVMVTNTTTSYVAVAFGSSTVTAAWPTTDAQSVYIVEEERSRVFSPATTFTYAAALSSSVSGKVYLTPGEGA